MYLLNPIIVSTCKIKIIVQNYYCSVFYTVWRFKIPKGPKKKKLIAFRANKT